MLVNVPHPICHVVEAFLVGDVIDKHDSHGLPERKRPTKNFYSLALPNLSCADESGTTHEDWVPVEAGGDGVESFLAGCVPNL